MHLTLIVFDNDAKIVLNKEVEDSAISIDIDKSLNYTGGGTEFLNPLKLAFEKIDYQKS